MYFEWSFIRESLILTKPTKFVFLYNFILTIFSSMIPRCPKGGRPAISRDSKVDGEDVPTKIYWLKLFLQITFLEKVANPKARLHRFLCNKEDGFDQNVSVVDL